MNFTRVKRDACGSADGLRIVKIGGSLLRSSDGMLRAIRWVDRNPRPTTIVITGGGDYADAVRVLDTRSTLGDTLDANVSHQLAMRSMTLMSFVISHVADWPVVREWRQLVALSRQSESENPVCLFDAVSFLRTNEQQLPGTRLPTGWSVTSDSIAARVAECLQGSLFANRHPGSQPPALELVLLKSCAPPLSGRIADAVRVGFVDPFFGLAASGLKVTKCIDLSEACGIAEVSHVILHNN